MSPRRGPAGEQAIVLVSGVGDGVTELGAFDDALADAGLHNYNLVTLSSVIPSDASVEVRERFPADRDLAVGDAVAVVLARGTGSEGRETVAAGLGWATAAEGGVFFEATGATASECRAKVEAELEGARARRDWDWQDEGVHTAAHDADGPAAAVVVAVYGPLSLTGLSPVDG